MTAQGDPATLAGARGRGRTIEEFDMANATCSLDGCEYPVRARGYCNNHYHRWRRNGDPGPAGLLRRKPSVCSAPACERPSRSQGLCGTHYQRLKTRGTITLPDTPSTEERFWSKVEPSETGCWLWVGAKNLQGYGKFYNRGAYFGAHRFSYEMTNDPIPYGMQADHLCFTPACVNPAHLRLVTIKQNMENRAGASKHSKSGVRGVVWDEARQKWAVYVGHEGKTRNAGRYATLDEAEAAAIRARNELHTHNDLDRV